MSDQISTQNATWTGAVVSVSEFHEKMPGVKVNPVEKGLPLGLVTECRTCKKKIWAKIYKVHGTVKFERVCPEHGRSIEILRDGLFTEKAPLPTQNSPTTTYTGSKIIPRVLGFPKTVETLCPECRKNVLGIEYEENDKIYMEKTCPEHGYFKDLLFSNAKLYRKVEKWGFEDGRGLSNPNVTGATLCPHECGLCNLHQSHTCLGVVDLTNRCNLTCPVCFANSNIQGFVYEPTFEQAVGMMRLLREERPVPATAVQFSGGEPTLHPNFLDLIKKAKEMGFSHIQVATNGIKFANNLEFTKKCAEAGLHELYLQYDGDDDEVYKKTRGRPLFKEKLACVENTRKTDMKICLVPTIINNVNDHQVVPIIKFAIEHIDVISGISFQPVAFTGRVSLEERERHRFTLADMARLMEEAGLAEVDRDFYPLAMISPFSKLLSAITGDPKITMTAHAHCSTGSYFIVDKQKNATPVTQFIDIEGLLSEMNVLALRIKKSKFKLLTKISALASMKKYYDKDKAPKEISFTKFLQAIQGLTDKNLGRGKKGEKNLRTLLVAGMHFMDCYNYDVERVKRCLIHYPTPEGKLYPFCTYNSGPTFRDKVEKKFARAK